VTILDHGELRVVEHDDPRPGTGQILVRVCSAGLNGADQLQRRGRYPAPPGAPPDIPGLEFAGEVVETGADARRFAVGDRVMGIVAGGGQAELVVTHERLAMPVPNGMDCDAAGGFAEVFVTAHDALFAQADLRPGERVLITGAAGGVGTAAIQLATAAGARPVASVRRAPLHDAVSALGATEVVTPDQVPDLAPVDVILELVGAPSLTVALQRLAPGGRVAVIGVGAGVRAEIDLLALMRVRGRLHGSTLRARPLEDKALATRRVEREVLPALAAGRLHVPVDRTFALDEAEAAYDRFAAGGKLGKIVLATGAA
jgi:NADPH:quinone reductase-like Zn-dependent oxidoreductase